MRITHYKVVAYGCSWQHGDEAKRDGERLDGQYVSTWIYFDALSAISHASRLGVRAWACHADGTFSAVRRIEGRLAFAQLVQDSKGEWKLAQERIA